jgi:hypothetical protein
MEQDSLGHGKRTGLLFHTQSSFFCPRAATHLCGVLFLAQQLVASQTKVDFCGHTEMQISFNKKAL